MTYYMFKAVLAINPRIEITQPEFAEIVSAWESIAAVLEIEEEWESLIQNYIEFETELLKVAMQSMVLGHESYHDMHQDRVRFTRRLSNLLQTCRSYLDHTPHHLGKLDDVQLAEAFRTLTNQAHSEHFAYRFMEAMRNYAQHRGVPLHSSTYNSEWIEDADSGEEKGWHRHAVTATVNLKRIREDKKFNAKLRAEIEGMEQLDVATLTREYLEALGWVHSELRGLLKHQLGAWKATIRSAIERYAAANDGDVAVLTVAEFVDAEHYARATSIFEEMLTRQERLVRRNRNLVNLRRRFVSNELQTSKPRRHG